MPIMQTKQRWLVIAVIVALAITAFYSIPWCTRQWAYHDTVYAKGFSQSAFSHITPGTPRSAVLAAVGQPLRTDVEPNFSVSSLFDERDRKRYAGSAHITLERLMFSLPKPGANSHHWVSVTIGPDDVVIGVANYIED